MEGVGARLGRTSTRYGPATVFTGPVRKWKKKWVHVAPSTKDNNNHNHNHNHSHQIHNHGGATATATAANGTSTNGNNGSHLLLYKWTPITQSQNTNNNNNNSSNNNSSSNNNNSNTNVNGGDKSDVAAAPEEPPRRKIRYIPYIELIVVELVWEMIIWCVEFSSVVFDVDFVEGEKFLHSLKCGSIVDAVEAIIS